MTTDSLPHYTSNDIEVEGFVKYFVAPRYFDPSGENASSYARFANPDSPSGMACPNAPEDGHYLSGMVSQRVCTAA
jgi:hypothetical protein